MKQAPYNYKVLVFDNYNEVNIKKIQRDWNKFFEASVCVGTASKRNLYPSRITVLCIHFI